MALIGVDVIGAQEGTFEALYEALGAADITVYEVAVHASQIVVSTFDLTRAVELINKLGYATDEDPPDMAYQRLGYDHHDGRYHGVQSDGTSVLIDGDFFLEARQGHERDGLSFDEADDAASDADAWGPEMDGWIVQ